MNSRFGFFAFCVALFLASPTMQLNSPVQAKVEFTGPEEVKVGENFIGKCSVQLVPSNVNHNVTFYLNSQPLGHYVVKGEFSDFN